MLKLIEEERQGDGLRLTYEDTETGERSRHLFTLDELLELQRDGVVAPAAPAERWTIADQVAILRASIEQVESEIRGLDERKALRRRLDEIVLEVEAATDERRAETLLREAEAIVRRLDAE